MFIEANMRRKFPRARARGPIEAWPSSANSRSSANFRARERAAPLKPKLVRLKASSAEIFPRARARGPIEATTTLPLQDDNPHFRVRERAAPLKRRVPGDHHDDCRISARESARPH